VAAAWARGKLVTMADVFVHGCTYEKHHADLAKIPLTVYPDLGAPPPAQAA